jgi:hypothetical protein
MNSQAQIGLQLRYLARQINILQQNDSVKSRQISTLQGQILCKDQQISALNEQVGRLYIRCNFLEEQNGLRFTEIRLLDQDAKLWGTWYTVNVTTSVLHQVFGLNHRDREESSKFQNALVGGGNSLTLTLKRLFDILGFSEIEHQQTFAQWADMVVDNRNNKAHFYRGVGLSRAVNDTLEMLGRHPSLLTADEDMKVISFCKSFLEKYYTFAPQFSPLFEC